MLKEKTRQLVFGGLMYSWRGRRATRQPESGRGVVGRFFWYAAILLTAYAAAALGYDGAKAALERSRAATGDGAVGGLRARLAFYAAHRERFPLVFVGDSRVYCAIHPERLAPLLGVPSINLSAFAHWLPTQLPFLRDLVPLVPRDTTLVLGVGLDSFSREDYFRATYPLRWEDVPRYRKLGYSWREMAPNLLAPVTGLYLDRPALRDKFLNLLDRPLWQPVHSPASGPVARRTVAAADPVDRELQRVRADPATARVDVLRVDGEVTSLAVYHRGGGYERVEIDGNFFRRKQQELRAAVGPALSDDAAAALPLPTLDPGQLGIFAAMLDLIRERGAHLVVLELEDAPYTYRHPLVRERYRQLMDQVVRPLVAARGAVYLRLPLGTMEDADFFDHNHLNRGGIERYTPLLAAGLAPLLGGR